MLRENQEKEEYLKIPDNRELYDIEVSTLWIDEDGILCSSPKNIERTMEQYKEIIGLFAKLTNDGKNKLCLLTDASKVAQTNKEIKEYFAAELPKYIKAHAMISEQPLQGTVTSTFIKLSWSGLPICQFPNKKEAKEWLKTHL